MMRLTSRSSGCSRSNQAPSRSLARLRTPSGSARSSVPSPVTQSQRGRTARHAVVVRSSPAWAAGKSPCSGVPGSCVEPHRYGGAQLTAGSAEPSVSFPRSRPFGRRAEFPPRRSFVRSVEASSPNRPAPIGFTQFPAALIPVSLPTIMTQAVSHDHDPGSRGPFDS